MDNNDNRLGQRQHSGSNNNYDPSFTSVTLHSLDSIQPLTATEPCIEERRHSNFYLFEDDSEHEFDDEATGQHNGYTGLYAGGTTEY